MPDEDHNKKLEEIKETMDGVLGWIQKHKDQAKEKGTTHKPWGWVFGLIAAIIVFLALAFTAWQAWRKGREIAKLKHQVDVDREKKRQLNIDLQMAKTLKDQADLVVEAQDLRDKIAANESAISMLEKKRKEAHITIDAVTSWEDIDAILEKRK